MSYLLMSEMIEVRRRLVNMFLNFDQSRGPRSYKNKGVLPLQYAACVPIVEKKHEGEKGGGRGDNEERPVT